MYRYEFTDHDKTFTRVSKTIARKAFVEGFTIAMCPSNLRPGTPWHPEYITNRNMDPEPDFDKLINAFEWYNCTDTKTGKRASFFMEKNSPDESL